VWPFGSNEQGLLTVRVLDWFAAFCAALLENAVRANEKAANYGATLAANESWRRLSG
jgi:hypothetical protein